MLKYKSKVGQGSNSLRVIIPNEIVKITELNAGDYLTWNVEVTENNINIQVKKDEN